MGTSIKSLLFIGLSLVFTCSEIYAQNASSNVKPTTSTSAKTVTATKKTSPPSTTTNKPAKPKYSGPVYKIKVKINGLKDTTIRLGHHFGNNKYVVDTAKLNSKGEGMFVGDSLLDGGIYLIITPQLNYFEIIIDKDQDFSITTDTVEMVKNLKIEGSDENIVFNDYQKFMIEKQEMSQKNQKKYASLKKLVDSTGVSVDDKKKYTEELNSLKTTITQTDSLVKARWNSIITQYPNSLLSVVLKAMKEVDVPPFPRNDKGEIIDSAFQYKYYKQHYLDNIDFTDYRLLRTPILENKIDEYFEKVIYPPIPDTISYEVDKLIEKSKGNSKMYRFLVQFLFNKYNNPKIMGMDRVFVHIADKYYLSGLATWAQNDTAFMKSVKDRVVHQRYNLIGETAQELRLMDLNNSPVSLHSIDADYIELYFFDTDCGHCQ